MQRTRKPVLPPWEHGKSTHGHMCVLQTLFHGCVLVGLHLVIPCISSAFGEHLLVVQVEDFWQHLRKAE